MPPDLAFSLTIIGSNYPCLELIFMVPEVFEPLKFDCILLTFCHLEFFLSLVLFVHSVPLYVLLCEPQFHSKELVSCTYQYSVLKTIYSRLSLSRNRRDPQKQFEISVLRHIRFVVLRKKQFEQPIFTNDYVI